MKNKYDLLLMLKEQGITFQEYTHEPLSTTEQAKQVMPELLNAWCKNLFLKDDKKNLYLITALADTSIKLKEVSKFLSAPGLRFANEELLMQHLGLLPGSVTPFGIINDTNHQVKVVLDAAIFSVDHVALHPLENSATLLIKPDDLKRFIDHCGNTCITVDFNAISIG
jgi:Ala-tRNA(Pro) deacylase